MSSNIPVDLCYSESHEWARANDDGTVTVGITDHAQHLLGDLVFVEIPEVGRAVAAAESCAVVESVKAASDLYAPVAGEVVAVNQDIVDTPDAVNADAYANWLFKLQPTNAADVATLLDAAGYAAEIAQA